jgi:hypothetical protein
LQAVSLTIIDEGGEQVVYQGGGQIPILAVGVNTGDIGTDSGGNQPAGIVPFIDCRVTAQFYAFNKVVGSIILVGDEMAWIIKVRFADRYEITLLPELISPTYQLNVTL